MKQQNKKTTYTINGVTYNSLEEMSAEQRKFFSAQPGQQKKLVNKTVSSESQHYIIKDGEDLSNLPDHIKDVLDANNDGRIDSSLFGTDTVEPQRRSVPDSTNVTYTTSQQPGPTQQLSRGFGGTVVMVFVSIIILLILRELYF